MASSNSITGARFTETSADRKFALGTISESDDGTVWQYVQASAAVNIYDFVGISEAYTIAQGTHLTLTVAKPMAVGCAQVAFAINEYGWVCRQGTFTGNIKTLAVANTKLLSVNGTAGYLDDTGTATVLGVRCLTTVGGADAATACFSADMMISGAAAT
jgi:hypothetical protein